MSLSCGAVDLLDQVGDVHWHFLDLSGIELFDVTHHSDILSSDKIDSNTRNISSSYDRG